MSFLEQNRGTNYWGQQWSHVSFQQALHHPEVQLLRLNSNRSTWSPPHIKKNKTANLLQICDQPAVFLSVQSPPQLNTLAFYKEVALGTIFIFQYLSTAFILRMTVSPVSLTTTLKCIWD